MFPILTLLAALQLAAQTPPATPALAPLPRLLFVDEKWYKDTMAEEKLFEGVLEINPGEGRIGIPERFNSFRLTSLEDGKPVIRQVYTQGKDHLLSASIGHNVKLTAKLVETQVNGTKLAELWPAKMEVLGLAPAGVIAEWKIIARSNNYYPSRQPAAVTQQTIIRTAKQLADYMGMGGTAPATTEEAATSRMSQMLGNQKIDWTKHMLVAISGGNRAGAARVEISRITFGEKGLDVHWKLGGPNAGSNRPIEIVLINKYDGDLRFFQEGNTRPIVMPGPLTQPK